MVKWQGEEAILSCCDKRIVSLSQRVLRARAFANNYVCGIQNVAWCFASCFERGHTFSITFVVRATPVLSRRKKDYFCNSWELSMKRQNKDSRKRWTRTLEKYIERSRFCICQSCDSEFFRKNQNSHYFIRLELLAIILEMIKNAETRNFLSESLK